MPRFSTTIYDEDGRPIGIACGSRPYKKCATPECHQHADKLCDYPVTRDGQPGTCDRAVCSRCAVRVGRNRDYCPPHARASKEPHP